MTELKLAGKLNLRGKLNLVGDGGKVLASGEEVLVEVSRGGPKNHGDAPVPVLIPPQAPVDKGTTLWIYRSFNATVKANGGTIVTLGLCAQGKPGQATWPGIVQRSVGNEGAVTVNNIPINVQNDTGVILATGATVTFTKSCQQ